MPRIMTDAQEKLIISELPSSCTIGSNTHTFSKIYHNQEISSYPTVTFNFTNIGIDTKIRDISDGDLYYKTTATLHILAKDASGDKGAIIAEQVAQAIITELITWASTPLTGDVRIFDPAEDIQALGFIKYDTEIFDYVLTINIYYA